ncbi:MAG: hypothetical protein ACOCWJ_03010 [Verrucomicrobiota bacterium]
MELHISIRNNLREGGDPFDAARVERFEADRSLSFGAADDCDCQIDDPAVFPARHFELLPPPSGGRSWTLRTISDEVAVFINGEQAADGQPVGSGDELRVGHWTLLVHRIPSPGEYQFRSDRSGVVNRLLVVAILVSELIVIVWLPQHLQASSLWETGRLRQETSLLLDELSNELKAEKTPEERLESEAYSLLAREVDHLSRFLQEHGRQLEREQWRDVRHSVEQYRRIKDRVDHGLLVQPLPQIDMEAAVQAVLKSQTEPSAQSPSAKSETP